MLVCERRSVSGPEVAGLADGEMGRAFIIHPIVIVLSEPITIGGHFRENNFRASNWTREAPENHQIERREAQLALAEAWRGIANYKFDPETLCFTSGMSIAKVMKREATIARNTLLWIYWHRWNLQGLTLEQRAENLRSRGYDCAEGALKSLLKDTGMSIP